MLSSYALGATSDISQSWMHVLSWIKKFAASPAPLTLILWSSNFNSSSFAHQPHPPAPTIKNRGNKGLYLCWKLSWLNCLILWCKQLYCACLYIIFVTTLTSTLNYVLFQIIINRWSADAVISYSNIWHYLIIVYYLLGLYRLIEWLSSLYHLLDDVTIASFDLQHYMEHLCVLTFVYESFKPERLYMVIIIIKCWSWVACQTWWTEIPVYPCCIVYYALWYELLLVMLPFFFLIHLLKDVGLLTIKVCVVLPCRRCTCNLGLKFMMTCSTKFSLYPW